MYKAIIFDFFDVIRTDPYNAWLKENGFKREGPYLKAAQDQDRGKITVDEFLARLSQLSGQEVTIEKLEAGAKIHDDVVTLIDELKPHYRIALLSNAPSVFLRDLLVEHNLARHFNEIIISSEVGHIKPDREIFEIATTKLGVAPSEVIFIDDNRHHTDGAEQVGIKSIVFTSAGQLRRDLAACGITITATR